MIDIGGKSVMPFTIPSGIVTTEVSCLDEIASSVPEIGVATTKSIGPVPRLGNRESILAQYMPGGYVNAVGLTNPGAEEFARKLDRSKFPIEKFLLASIFGKDEGEFVFVAKTLEDHVNGFELNLSCPHAKGYGMQLGQDKDTVAAIVRAVVSKTRRPVFAKLTPNAGNIGEIAKAAIAAGAYGITAINTVGPGYYSVDGNPVLTNKVGGMSGVGILPIGLKCVRDIRKAVGPNVPIIGMGGIASARDVEAYASAGANVFGIGSALAGMTNEDIRDYFSALVADLESNGRANHAEGLLKKVDMSYRKVKVGKVLDSKCDFRVIQTDAAMECEPGQFVFAWIPGVGEKPFSVMDDDPFTLGVLERGEFTRHINSLREGDSFYVRGPYGQGIDTRGAGNSRFVLVGGGCGIAGLHLLAKRFSEYSDVTTLLAAKDGAHIPYIRQFEQYGDVKIATEDGSLGRKGLVTDLIMDSNLVAGSYFFNCGPKAMVTAVLPLEISVSDADRVYSSVDYMTRCGVGICGSCADGNGRRTCVEGPFMNPIVL